MSEDKPKSRLFEHAESLYTRLAKDAVDGIFTGSMVQAFRDIGVSQAYYSRIYRTLEEIGSIELLQSGRGGRQPSIIKLHHAPESANFEAAYDKALTNPTPLDTLRQRVHNVEGRLPSIDISSALADHEQRLKALEDKSK